MSEAVISSVTALIIAGFAGLRWWIEHRDMKRKASGITATLDLTESESTKTIRTLRRQLRDLEETNDRLRDELNDRLMDDAERLGGRRSTGGTT